MARVEDTHYILGSVVGPHPFPMIVRDFQAIIGVEARRQILEVEGRLPDVLLACVGGGSNSLGLFHSFYDDREVQFIGVEAAGLGFQTGLHAMSITTGHVGVFHGAREYVLQNDDGQIKPAHSISAGLDYPGVGPEHCFYHKTGRARYVAITDDESLEGVKALCELEGIIPALEPAHAVAHLILKMRDELPDDAVVIICLSGRGDKDVYTLQERLGKKVAAEC
jgi:tryptophan synthase beta chain